MTHLPTSLRRTAELLSRNVVLRTRLPARFGRRPIYLSPANALSVLKPGVAKFDPYLFALADRFVTDRSVIWDIGANAGVFALAAAHRARHVTAIEPDPFNLALLHRTRALVRNRDLALDILPAAVSHEIGIASLRIPARGRAANSLAGATNGTQMGGVRDEIRVITVTLDWLLDHTPAPTFVKCDAEGAEHWILRGASRLLREVRPTIVFELEKPNAAECADILFRSGYAAYCAKTERGPLDDLAPFTEILAIPRDVTAPKTVV
jgi:FkbM family methyltransferase